MAYETTEVAVSTSQGHIRDILQRHRVTELQFGEGTDERGGWARVEFVRQQHVVRITARYRPVDRAVVAEKERRSRTKTGRQIEQDLTQQEARRVWRVLYWTLKARLEAIDEGLEVFEQAFLPYLVNPANEMTVWEGFKDVVLGGALRVNGAGLPALPAGRE